MVYRLDAMEAYNKRLVKKIAVKGITESGSTATDGYVYLESINLSKADPTATIQFDFKGATSIRKKTMTVGIGFNLYDNSNGMEEYKDGFVVKFIDGRDNHIEFLNGIKIYAGDVIGRVSEEQLRRIQIRETILSHIERERQLFHKGIKVLSLFFIDEVAKYKQYDAAGQAYNGIYADMFEEEYADIVGNLQLSIGDEAYIAYLNAIEAKDTHAGYFSVDKKGKMTDSKPVSYTHLDVYKRQDIHWNPVRIIQRFGRIDRIGSKNSQIQLVNFWPDMDLDEYINLKSRVETRMKISVMTSTGDDDLINPEEKGDLEYRKAQLKRLQEEVVDIEDVYKRQSLHLCFFHNCSLCTHWCRHSQPEIRQCDWHYQGLFQLRGRRSLYLRVIWQRGRCSQRSWRRIRSSNWQTQACRRL